MTSKITIEIDFEHGNEPIIQILYRPSDDVRDKLIKSFIEQLRQVSSWCEIYCANAMQETDVNYAVQRWIIKPITPERIEQVAEVITEQARVINGSVPNFHVKIDKRKLENAHMAGQKNAGCDHPSASEASAYVNEVYI